MKRRFVFLFCLGLIFPAQAKEKNDVELETLNLKRVFDKNGGSKISFSVKLESPFKGRLHKVSCRLDKQGFANGDAPIDLVKFVSYEGPLAKKHKFTFDVDKTRVKERLNVFCLAKARL